MIVNDLLLNGENSTSIFGTVEDLGTSNFAPIIEFNPLSFVRFSLFTVGGTRLRANIGDLIVYDQSITQTERIQVETYLAVKYGVTLSILAGGIQGDYISTTGTTVWDASANPTYQNDIIGIARDDAEGLEQKQSHAPEDSSFIYINALAVSNATNNGNFTVDNSYVLMGHNNGQVCNTNASAAEVPTGIANCNFYSRGDFSNGGTNCFSNGDGTGIVISFNGFVINIANISPTHFANNSTRYWTIGSVNSLTPLPVELSNYTVECFNEQASLSWSTISEVNSANFIIERSTDLQTFETVGTVQSIGNSTQTQNYTWTDASRTYGSAYYRLSQVDVDGSQEFFEIKSVHCGENQAVSIYPNPFDDEIYVDLKYGGNLVITDKSGRIFLQKEMNAGATSISLNSLATGLYFTRLYLHNGQHEVRKIIKI